MTYLQLLSKYKTIYSSLTQRELLEFIYLLSKQIKDLNAFASNCKNEIDFSEEKYLTNIKQYIDKQKPLELINNKTINFCDTKINIKNKVFIPRVETEIMVKQAIDLINKYQINNVCDLCAGSGAIGLSIKNNTKANVTLVDINKDCISLIKANAKTNNLINLNISCSDYFQYLINNKNKYDLIIMNPPYVDQVELNDNFSKYETKISFNNSSNPLEFYLQIIKNWKTIFNESFILICEFGYNQKKELTKIIQKYQLAKYTKFYKDYGGNDRYFVIDHYINNNIYREKLLKQLKNIKNKKILDRQINKKLSEFIKNENKYIALYYPLPIEPDIIPTIKMALANKKKVCLPYINNKEIGFKEINSFPFQSECVNNISQPKEGKIISLNKIGLLIAPMVGTYHGYRLGHGSNFYNQLFSSYPQISKYIVGYKFQETYFNIKPHYLQFKTLLY